MISAQSEPFSPFWGEEGVFFFWGVMATEGFFPQAKLILNAISAVAFWRISGFPPPPFFFSLRFPPT